LKIAIAVRQPAVLGLLELTSGMTGNLSTEPNPGETKEAFAMLLSCDTITTMGWALLTTADVFTAEVGKQVSAACDNVTIA